MTVEGIEFKIEPLSLKHAPAVRELFFETYRVTRPGFPEQKYNLNSGQCYARVMVADDKVVAFCGLQILHFSKGEDVITVPEFCEFLIDRKYRSKGIFKLIFEQVKQELREQGMNVVMGFQSNTSYEFCMKAGFENYRDVQRFHIKGFPQKLAQAIRAIGLENWKRKRIARKLKKYQVKADWSHLGALEGYYNSICDADFMERKCNGDYYCISIDNCRFILCYKRYMEVGAMEVPEGVDLGKVLEKLKKLMRACMVHDLVFQVVRDERMYDLLKVHLKPAPSFPVGYLILADGGRERALQLNIRMLDADTF